MSLFSKLTRSGEKKPVAGNRARQETRDRYHGVEIVPGKEGCCNAVRAVAGTRFLANEAPRLPLNDCDLPSCNCHYQRYTDRRTDARRDADVGIGTATQLYGGDNQRLDVRGRRSDD